MRYEIPLRMLRIMFADGMASRAELTVRARGLTYGVGAWNEFDRDFSAFGIRDESDPSTVVELFEGCIHELHELLYGEVTSDEWERAKGYAKGKIYRSLQMPMDYVGWYARDFSVGMPFSHPEDEIKAIDSLTLDEMRERVQDFFAPGNWVLSILGKNISSEKRRFARVLEKYF